MTERGEEPIHGLDAAQTRLSKRLALVLRHNPASIGIALTHDGWADVASVLRGLSSPTHPVTRADLSVAVERNAKRRYEFDETGARIRARQGHSVDVDLGLEPCQPPATLFHGTTASAWALIRAQGLRRMKRHHVHLCIDTQTATTVGARRGQPVILRVDAAAMAAAGYTFYCSANGVWLVDAVPPEYLVEFTAEHPHP